MELQKLTEELLQTLFSLNRSPVSQKVQSNLQGESFLLAYLESHHGESTPGDLCTALGVSAPRTAAMLRALEGKGFLQRHVNGCDKRRIVVTMTEDGHRAAMRKRQDFLQRLRFALEQLGEQDAREFIRILGRIADIEGLQPMVQGVTIPRGLADA